MHIFGQQQLHLSLAAAFSLCILILLSLGCADKDPSPQSPSGLSSLVDPKLVRANEEIQDLLASYPPDFSPSEEMFIYSRMGKPFANIETRRAAEDRLFDLWEKDPENFIWIDLAINKYMYLSRLDDLDRMIQSVTQNDSSAIAHFVYWRLNAWTKADASDRLNMAEQQQSELNPLQKIWLQNRLALTETRHGLYKEATIRLLESMPEALEHGGLPLVVYYWYELSVNYMLMGQHNEALFSISSSLQFAEKMDNIYQEVRCRLKMGLIHQSRGEYKEAREVISSCFVTANDNNLVRKKRTALIQLSILEREEGNTRAELDLMKRIARMAIAQADTYIAVNAITAAGNVYRRLGVIDSTEIWLNKALDLSDEWSRNIRFPELDGTWIRYYHQIGNYAQADSILNLVSVGLVPEQKHTRRIDNVILMIKQGLETGRADLAYAGIQRAQALSLVGDGPNTGYSPSLELATVSARFFANQGEFQQAQQQIALASEALSTSFNTENQLEYEQCRGEVAYLAEDYIGASRYFSKCWELSKEIQDPSLKIRNMVKLGESYLHLDQFEEAHDLFFEAHQSPEYWPRLTASLYLGIAAAEQGNHQLAQQYYSATDSLLGPTPPIQLQARLTLSKSISQIALGNPQVAYSLLLEVPQNIPLRNTGPKRKGLRSGDEALRAFHLNMSRDRAEAIIGLLYDHPDLVESSSPALAALLAAEVARWRPGKDFNMPDANGLEHLTQTSNGPLLAFFIGEDRSFSWLGTADGWTLNDLGPTALLKELVSNVVTDMEYPGRAIDTTLRDKLSNLLLGDLKSQWTQDQPLSVITDAFLHNVPFAALVDGYAPIIHLTSLSVRSSGQPRTPTENPHTLLALGIDKKQNMNHQDNGFANPELRFAESEAQAIAAMWESQNVALLLGEDAHWDAFISQDLKQFSAIHIATHAQITQGLPGASTLRFAEGVTSTPVSISEVRELDLQADLVFLSCCETGRMDNDTGSGLNSFARAFLQAGSSSVLAPVIRVEDEASRYLAQQFYHHWLQGKSRAASLKAAQFDTRNAREDWSHPYYWAFIRLYMLPDYSSSPGF